MGPVTAGGPPSWPAFAGGRRRRTANPAATRCTAGGRRRQARAGGVVGLSRAWGKGRLAGLALVSAALQPVDGRPLARPAVGSRACRRRAPDPLALVCLRRFLAAVLRIVRARSGPSSPSVPPGPAARESLLRRSFVAYFLRRFPGSCPAGRRACTGTAPQASPAAKTTGGEGSWPVI